MVITWSLYLTSLTTGLLQRFRSLRFLFLLRISCTSSKWLIRFLLKFNSFSASKRPTAETSSILLPQAFRVLSDLYINYWWDTLHRIRPYLHSVLALKPLQMSFFHLRSFSDWIYAALQDKKELPILRFSLYSCCPDTVSAGSLNDSIPLTP